MSIRMMRVLVGGLAFVVLVALALGTLRRGIAQGNPPVRLLIDSPDFPDIPGMGGDCELHAFERQYACLNTYFNAMNSYHAAPQACPSTPDCLLPCFFNPTGPECTQCVSSCTSQRHEAYYQAEQRLSTASCGVCPAGLDFCAGARAAAEACTMNYQNCGGLFVEGCWETFAQCRLDSGIDQCQ